MWCPVGAAAHVSFPKVDVLSSVITQLTLITRSQLRNAGTDVANNIFGDEIFTVLAVKVACCFIPVNTK